MVAIVKINKAVKKEPGAEEVLYNAIDNRRFLPDDFDAEFKKKVYEIMDDFTDTRNPFCIHDDPFCIHNIQDE
jgi:hypothetical protein